MPDSRTECDISKTQLIADLLQTPRTDRDDAWTEQFLLHVQTASLTCGDPQVLHGPDSFPYFQLHLPEPGKPFTSYCISNMMEDFLLDNGTGVVIQPRGDIAEFVFSYGDIVNLYLNKVFYSPPVEVEITPQVTLKKEEQLLIAQPSEAYLPARTRTVLRKYLQYYNLKEPKIMLITRHAEGKIIQQLAINIFKEEVAHPEHLDAFMQQLGWFLPKHYILVIVPKDSELANHFEDL